MTDMTAGNRLTLLADFDAQTIARGTRYHRQGHVLDHQHKYLDDGCIEVSGRVSGNATRPYKVSVTLETRPTTQVLSTLCSCYLGGDCKHAVALLLAWAEQQGTAPQAMDAESQRRRALDDEQRQAQHWLRQLETQQRNRPGPEGRLRYLLERGSDPRKLVLRVWREKVLKQGQYGKPEEFRRFAEIGFGTRPAFVQEEDITLLGLLSARINNGLGTSLISDQDSYLLELLINTGRAHVGTLEGPLLRSAAACNATLAWHAEGEEWRLRLEGIPADTLAILAEPPRYVCLTDGSCGLLQVPFSSHRLRPLLEAPGMRAETLALLLPRLRPLLPDQLEMPVALATAPSPVHQPMPCLRLRLIEIDLGRKREKLAVATVRFAYGVHEVAAETASEWVHDAAGHAVVLRDPAWEQEALLPLDGQLLPLRQFAIVRSDYGSYPPGCYLPVDARSWPQVLGHLVPRLENAGWRIEIDPEFPWQRQRVDSWEASTTDRGDWFGVELGVELNGRRVNLLPLLCEAVEALDTPRLRQLANDPDAVIDLWHDDQWLQVPAQRLLPLVELLNRWSLKERGRGELLLRRLDAARLIDLDVGAPWKASATLQALGRQLEHFEGIPEVVLPAGFQATLRPYQQHGYNWLVFLREQGLGGVLADDMGLGKTVQTLAMLAHEKIAGRLTQPALVACPTSLLANWRSEAQRFAPMLRVFTWHGSDRNVRAQDDGQPDVVLTSHALLSRDASYWQEQHFSVVLFDEAQHLKNPRSLMFGAARHLKADCRIALTGTPMENHLGDLWAIFELVLPGYLGSQDAFRRYFRVPIEKDGDTGRRTELIQRIKPLLVRRTKDQVVTELPPKTVMVRPVSLQGAQRDLYETVRSSVDSQLQAVLARKGLARSSIEVLDALLKLRQVCCDPRLLKVGGQGDVGSAKLELLFTMLPELISEGRRILLFSQFTSMLALIEQRLDAEGMAYVKLTGQTRDRAAPVDTFQSGKVPLFLISLKAGGVGLNLTAADTVIHYDPWWNPAVEEQATDRAYRIGQDKPVFVYKLIAEGTVESRIMALQQRKADLASGIYGESEGFSGLLGTDDLSALLSPLDA